MYAIKTIEYRTFTIKVYYDENPTSPREWDNLGTIYSNHRYYDFDGHKIEELIDSVGGDIYDSVIPWDLIAEKYYYRKVWMYDHSGVSVCSGERNPYDMWDSGLYGVIVCEKEKAKKEYKDFDYNCVLLRERVEKQLDAEIDVLDEYCRGEVYGFVITKGEDKIDSCFGFYGNSGLEDAIMDAKSVVDNEIFWKYKDTLFPEAE